MDKKRKGLFIIALIVIGIGLVGYSFLPSGGISMVVINDVFIEVEVADDALERASGLMFRPSLGENQGMLFVFDKERQLSFWMKNTLIPLDLIFVDDDLVIIDIKEDFEPCRAEDEVCKTYSSYGKYVIEVNSGYVEAKGIVVGDGVEFR